MKSTLLAATAALGLSACGAPASPIPSGSLSAAGSDATPGPIAEIAPATCGFEEGTRLIFAGRATTAALQVQEVIGDPMSNDPADIYITFDEFDNGAVRGRQVCAIYVDHPGFVELTLAPEGWSPETGRPPATPTPVATEAAESLPPFVVSADEAEAAARRAVPQAAQLPANVTGGRLGGLESVEPFEWNFDLAPEHPIWVVGFSDPGRLWVVIVDAESGDVLDTAEFIP